MHRWCAGDRTANGRARVPFRRNGTERKRHCFYASYCKRQKLAAPHPTGPQEQSSMSLSQKYKHWRKLLTARYLIDDPLSLIWPPLETIQFIQLSLVTQSKGARHLDLKTVYGKIDDVYGDKTSVAIKNVFHSVIFRSLILFEGRPGSGKTTLMIEVSRKWAKGELFQSKLLFLIQLRHLDEKKDVNLCDLFRVACSTLSDADVRGLTSYIEGTLGEGVVFILDGFDEYTPGSTEDNFIYKLIAKYIFPESIVIVSSRPAATQPFRRKAAKWIEVVGFMEKEVNNYIFSYYVDNQIKAEMLVKHLKQHPNLMNLCYLPLHCAMLVFLYEEDVVLPKTETEFYRDFTLSTLVRCNCKKSGKVPSHFSTFDNLPHNEKIIFKTICKLAFEATIASKQVFKLSELQTISFDGTNEDVNSLGLVVIDKYFVKFGLDQTYTFLHLTLQEYLSAVYIAGLSATKQEAIIKEHGNKQNLFVTWRFLFGTLDYSKDTTTNLFKLMMDTTHEVVNSCNLSIQCAFESQNDLACSHVMDFYKNKFTFSELSLTSTDIDCIIHLVKCSKCSDIHLSFEKCMLSEDDAIVLLQGIGDCQLSLTLIGDERSLHPPLIHCVPLLNALNVVSAVSAPNLVQLEVRQFNSEEILEFPNLKNIATLQALKFDYMAEIAGVEECFQNWPKLKELYLCDYYCDVTHAQAVIKELKFCPQLQRLTFSGRENRCCLDESTCRVLGETLQYLPKLQHIDLGINVDIDDSAVAHLAKGLTHCAHLEELDLGRCRNISDSGATHLAEGLAHCPHLKELNLWWCKIGDTGVKVLLESLIMNCKGIRELNLDDNELTNESIPCLTEFIKSSRNLVKLVLLEDDGDYTKFTERGWSKLVEAVEQRNSTEGMTQLELVGETTVESEEESSQSDEESGALEEESDESEEGSGESELASGEY